LQSQHAALRSAVTGAHRSPEPTAVLAAVKVVRPTGRSTLTAAAGRRSQALAAVGPGKWSATTTPSADTAVDDFIRCVDDAADVGGEVEERDHQLPRLAPAPDDGGVFTTELAVLKSVEGVAGGGLGRCGVDRSERGGDAFAVFVLTQRSEARSRCTMQACTCANADGSYQPWWAHNHALEQGQRPKPIKIEASAELRRVVLAKLKLRWSPQQIARFLARTYPNDPSMRLSAEAIYQGMFAGRLGKKRGKLRTGRLVRRKQSRGVAPPNKIKNMRSVHQRPAEVRDRSVAGHIGKAIY
jgi:hypothetical protein